MTYQELNGLTDWWNTGKNYINESIESAGQWVGSTVFDAYDWTKTKSQDLTDSTTEQLVEFQESVEKLFNLQNEVDKALANLPENSEVYQRLNEKRQEARGLFTEYIKPAWQKFIEWAGYENQANYNSSLQLGAIPLGIAAVLGAVSVAGYYISQSMELEREIINDPELKKKYLENRGMSLIDFGGSQQYLLFGGIALGVLGVVYVMRKNK